MMTRRWLSGLAVLLCLTCAACANSAASGAQAIDLRACSLQTGGIAFPGLTWESTLEDVDKALGVTLEEVKMDANAVTNMYGVTHTIRAYQWPVKDGLAVPPDKDGLQVLGVPVSLSVQTVDDRLTSVDLYAFSAEEDGRKALDAMFAAAEAQMTELFGPPTQQADDQPSAAGQTVSMRQWDKADPAVAQTTATSMRLTKTTGPQKLLVNVSFARLGIFEHEKPGAAKQP